MKVLDYLGSWKWPSIAAITLLPLGSFFLLNWDGFDDPVAEVILGPDLVAGRPVLLTRPANEPGHEWCARTCPTCWREVRAVAIGYGDARQVNGWTDAVPSRDRLCAALDPPAPGATHLWVRVVGPSGDDGTAAFPLDAAAPSQPE